MTAEIASTEDEEPTPKKPSAIISGRTLQKRYDPDAHMSVALENLGFLTEPSPMELRKKVAESYQDMQRKEIQGRINNPLPRILKEEPVMDVKKQSAGMSNVLSKHCLTPVRQYLKANSYLMG